MDLEVTRIELIFYRDQPTSQLNSQVSQDPLHGIGGPMTRTNDLIFSNL